MKYCSYFILMYNISTKKMFFMIIMKYSLFHFTFLDKLLCHSHLCTEQLIYISGLS